MCSSNADDKVKGTYRKNTGKYFTRKKSKFATCTLFTYILVLLVRCYYGPTGMQCGATMAQLGFGAPVRAIGAQLENVELVMSLSLLHIMIMAQCWLLVGSWAKEGRRRSSNQ